VNSSGRSIDVGGHRLYLRTTGQGTPAVVIDVGLGESHRNWGPVIQQIGAQTRVCVYDRAGYGDSEAGPFPRTAQQVVDELILLLTGAPVEPPYIIVGHSLGGLHALLLAAQHPEWVAGLVLLDPPPQDFIAGKAFVHLKEMADQQVQELRRAAEEASADNEPARATNLATLASEHEMLFTKSAQQLAAIDGLGDIPLIVIGSGIPNPAFGGSAPAFQEFWIESSRELTSLTTRGRFILAKQSRHHIHEDDPELVVDAIVELIRHVD
jgi:pimeloyl-ACP methyl ester carboxylesterase